MIYELKPLNTWEYIFINKTKKYCFFLLNRLKKKVNGLRPPLILIISLKMHSQSVSKLEVDIKNYERIKRINKGGFGTIYKVKDKKSGDFYAAKVIDCGDDQEECNKMIDREVGILLYSNHPTIIKFIGYSKLDFLEENNITIIMELATNGSLSNILKKIQEGNGPKN